MAGLRGNGGGEAKLQDSVHINPGYDHSATTSMTHHCGVLGMWGGGQSHKTVSVLIPAVMVYYHFSDTPPRGAGGLGGGGGEAKWEDSVHIDPGHDESTPLSPEASVRSVIRGQDAARRDVTTGPETRLVLHIQLQVLSATWPPLHDGDGDLVWYGMISSFYQLLPEHSGFGASFVTW